MRTGTAEGDAHDFRRRTYPSFGDDAVALAACGTDVAGEDRAGWRPGLVSAPIRLAMAQSLHRRSDRGSLEMRRPRAARIRPWPR